MSISKRKINFGTDGWRGIISKDFTFENIGRLTQKIIEFIKNRKENSVCIGYDNRFMSPEYAEFISAVLTDSKIEVDLSDNAVTTPMVSFRTKLKKHGLGIMVSASHNPANYNGIKLKENFGASASEKVVNSIIEGLNESIYEKNSKNSEFNISKNNWYSEYKKEMLDILPRSDGIKVACDFMHGSAFPYFCDILAEKGYDIVPVNSRRDPLFGGNNPEPKPETLKNFTEFIKSNDIDIGFAFDGDGDRIALVDENGELMSSQRILSLLVYDVLEQGKTGRIVKTVAGTYLVDRIAEEYKCEISVVPIGFKNISPELLKGDVLVAGEESGGIGFGDYIPERDSIYAACRILEMLNRRKTSVKQLWTVIEKKYGNSFYLRSDHVMKEGTKKADILDSVENKIKSKENSIIIENIIDIDGIRINMEGEKWLLIRPSGTEPLTRIYAETGDIEETKNLIEKGKELLL